MTRSKKFNKLLNKLDGRDCLIVDTDGNEIAKGKTEYKTENGQNVLYVNDKQIPISSLRGITYYGNGSRIIINPLHKNNS